MELSDSQLIKAPRDVVWAALNDPEILKACVPGCETVEKLSDTELQAKVTLKIGPVKASFTGKVTLSNLNPPHGYTISGEGQGGVAGHARGGADVRLEALSDEETMLHYDVRAEVGGKIAQLGARLIDGTAKKLAGEFFETFSTELAPDIADPNENPEGQQAPEGSNAKGKWWKFGRA